MLADIFAYNVKPDALDEGIPSFSAEHVADVLLIHIKRLPLRLDEKKADFDVDARKYHVSELSPSSRTHRVLEETKERDNEVGDGLPVDEEFSAGWSGNSTKSKPKNERIKKS